LGYFTPGDQELIIIIFNLGALQSDGRRARADTDENLQANLARAAKVVRREDVMRDVLTFHV